MSDTPAERPPACSFTHDDRTIHVSLLTQAKKDEFKKWLTGRARQILVELQGVLPPERWEQRLDSFESDVMLGRYDFSGRLAIQALRKPAGALAIAAILLGTDESEAGRILAECPEASIALKQALALSTPRRRPGQEDDQAEDQEGNVRWPEEIPAATLASTATSSSPA